MAADAMRAAKAAMAAEAGERGTGRADGDQAATAAGPPQSFEALLRELVDEQTYPRLYRLAWDPRAGRAAVRARGVPVPAWTLILDGVQALIDRAGR